MMLMSRLVDIDVLIDALIDMKVDAPRETSNVEQRLSDGVIHTAVGSKRKNLLKKLAKELDVNMSQVIRDALDGYLKHYGFEVGEYAANSSGALAPRGAMK